MLLENLRGRDHSKDIGVRKLKDNIRMDLRERVWGVVDWMHLVQNRDQ
jgi:hypothetical protein